jgi:uncharacterized protein YqkB
MQITFTEPALQQLEPYTNTELDGILKLVYDTEGCGCAVNGVASLWLVSEPGPLDAAAESRPIRVLYNPKHEIFFEEHLIIDYQPKTKSYIIKSNNQIYNSGVGLADKR